MLLVTTVHQELSKIIPLLAALHSSVSMHLLVCDTAKADKKVAEDLARGLRTWIRRQGRDVAVKTLYVDEDNGATLADAEAIFSSYEGEIALNVAGADFALAMMLAQKVSAHGGKVLAYDGADNTYNILQNGKMHNVRLRGGMGVDDFFMLNGEKIIKVGDKARVRKMRSSFYMLFGELGARIHRLRKLLRNKEHKQIANHYAHTLHALAELGIWDEDKKEVSSDFHDSNFGYLFESYLFLHLEQYDFDDIAFNLSVAFEYDDADDSRNVMNEFDIVVMKDNRPGFIECKFGHRKLQPESVIYKVDALMDYFGSNSRGVIVHVSDMRQNMRYKNPQRYTPRHKARANSKRIGVYHASTLENGAFKRLLEEYFGVRKRLWLMHTRHPDYERIMGILKHCGQAVYAKAPEDKRRIDDIAEAFEKKGYRLYAVDFDDDETNHSDIVHFRTDETHSVAEQIAKKLDCMYLIS